METKSKYDGMFKKFFKTRSNKSSTYQPAFLYALTDIGKLHDDEKLIGRDLLTPMNNKIQMDLNFVAIRFALYYWDLENIQIRHSSMGMASTSDPSMDVRIKEIIKKHPKLHKKTPNLAKLDSKEMNDFKKDVINIIKRDALNVIARDMNGLYKIIKRTNYIEFDADLIDYMKNSKFLKYRLKNKLITILKTTNIKPKSTSSKIQNANPFSGYAASKVPASKQDSIQKKHVDSKILKNYHSKCIACDIREKDLLVPGFILPRLNEMVYDPISNSICMCILHRKMFDKGYFHFDDQYGICIDNMKSSYLKKTITSNSIKKSSCDQFPSKEYLAEHKEQISLGLL